MDKTKQRILAALLDEPKTLWELITVQNYHLAHVVEVVKEMMEEKLISWPDHQIHLTSNGKNLAAEKGIKPFQSIVCTHCGKKTVSPQGLFQDVYEKMKKVYTSRPEAISGFDQGPVDAETVTARLMIMYDRGDLENKDIFILGDDDLTGLAAAFSGLPNQVTVVEVDERLVDFIKSRAEAEGLTNLFVHTYDVRQPLSDTYKKKFDTFFVDPVETYSGILLFITRAIESLKDEGAAGYFGLTHLEASRKKWNLIQKQILEMNFAITDILHNFQWYELDPERFVQNNYPLITQAPGELLPPEGNWYSSDLYRIEAVSEPKPLQLEKIPEGRELYFDDESYATLP